MNNYGRLKKATVLAVGPLLTLLAVGLTYPSSAGASTSPQASTAKPTVTIRLISESESNTPIGGGGTVHPDNNSAAICPNTLPGTNCTVVWNQSRGTSATTFSYYDVSTGTIDFLTPPYHADCQATTCQYALTGGGPGAIPFGWVVDGAPNQTTSIISCTEP